MTTNEQLTASTNGETPLFRPVKKDPHLLDFLTLLARHKIAIISGILLFGAAFLALAYNMPFKYSGSTLIIPPEKSQQSGLISFITGGSGALDLMKGGENPALDMFKNIIESRTIAEQVAHNQRIRRYFATFDTSEKFIVGAIHNSIQSEASRNSTFNVEITIPTHWDPSQVEKDSARMLVPYLAKTFVEHLDRYNRERLITQAHNTRVFVEGEYSARLQQLDTSYARLQAFQEEHKAISLNEQLAAAVNNAALLASQKQQLEMQLAVEERDLSPNSGRVQLLRSQLEEAERTLKKYDEGGAGNYVMAFKDVPALARQLAGMTREMKLLETMTAYLRQQLEQERINEQRDLPTFTVLDPAVAPDRKSSPSRLSMLLLGMMTGFILSLFYISIRNYYAQIDANPQEHTRYLNFMTMLRGRLFAKKEVSL